MLDGNTAALSKYMDEIEQTERDYECMLNELRSLGYDKARDNGILVEEEHDFQQIIEDWGWGDADLTDILNDL